MGRIHAASKTIASLDECQNNRTDSAAASAAAAA